MRTLNAVLAVAAVGVAAFAFLADASAQTRRDRESAIRSAGAPPLTIRRRPFTDSGPVVPPGSLQNYVNMDTIWGRPAWDHQRGRYGGETLPRPFDPPGRPSPLFNF